MERGVKGLALSLVLALMIVSNKFINLGRFQDVLGTLELIILLVAVFRFSGYSREELGIGGEFSCTKHVLFPFVFFIIPLGVVFSVPHNSISLERFVLYFVNFLIIAGLWEELVFRGLLFASLEERFGGGVALVGNSAIHWLFHFAVGLNISQFIAALILSSYRLAFRRIEPLIFVHAFWDTVFVSLTPRFVGSTALPVLVLPLLGALVSIVIFLSSKNSSLRLKTA